MITSAACAIALVFGLAPPGGQGTAVQAPAARTPSVQPPAGKLAFRPAGSGMYEFDTGLFKGRLKVDGKYQGLYPLVDSASGAELVHPPGVFSFYRAFSGNKRFGNAARDWPTTTRVSSDGAVEVRWASAPDHPWEMTGVYRWTAADTLDLEITVKPDQDLPRFELFMSSYFGKGFRASVYRKTGDSGQARFVPVDRKPDSKGAYVMFPRDASALEMIQDGRWKVGSNPVDWAIERWLAAPVILRRDGSLRLTAATMCLPADCFAVATPWNPADVTSGGYRSVYLSLFGRDIKAGQTDRALCRLIVARNLSDEQVLQRYEDFCKQQKR